MKKINTEARDRCYKEVAVCLKRAGFTTKPKEKWLLPVEWDGAPLCHVNPDGSVRYKDFSESVRPYLDYQVVGREYHAEHAGTFTEHGYILRRDIAEPKIAEREKEALFRVHLRKDGMMELKRPYLLELPASGAQLRYAADCLHIADLAEARIVKTECVRESLRDYIPLRHLSVDLLCDLADHLELALSDGGESKLLAVLAAEKPSTLEETLALVMGLDSYELLQCTCEEYGREALLPDARREAWKRICTVPAWQGAPRG